MRLRHELWKKKYPDSAEKHGIPWTGIENASPALKAQHQPPANMKNLPFDPLEYYEHLDELPFETKANPGIGG